MKTQVEGEPACRTAPAQRLYGRGPAVTTAASSVLHLLQPRLCFPWAAGSDDVLLNILQENPFPLQSGNPYLFFFQLHLQVVDFW